MEEWNKPAWMPLGYIAGVLVLVAIAATYVARHLPPRLATRRDEATETEGDSE